ncbi:MAG TPA: hypothetical protein VMV18_14415 [bacterium]|nr:hypothetical protein [bacterium]
MRRALPLALLAVALLVAACGEFGDHNIYGNPIRNGICTSNVQWHADASPEMDPGMDCVGCHAGNEGPNYAIAGTVFLGFHDEDDCYGQPGVTVTLVDSAGRAFTKVTNATGNFAFRPSEVSGLTWPIAASVSFNGNSRAMVTHQSVGACNTCHTPDGLNGAPGRIVVP